MSDTSSPDIDFSARRETGVEARTCPGCGATLAALEQPDSTTTWESCTTCYPVEVAEEPPADAPTPPSSPDPQLAGGDGSPAQVPVEDGPPSVPDSHGDTPNDFQHQ